MIKFGFSPETLFRAEKHPYQDKKGLDSVEFSGLYLQWRITQF
jgi:hypothetical protein